MEWIIAYTNSPGNQVNEACRNLGRVEWHYAPQTKRIDVGDIVYLYETAPEKRIRWKCEVTDIEITSSGPTAYFPDDGEEEPAFVLTPLYEYISPQGLELSDLADNGCGKVIRGPFRLEAVPQLARYLHKIDDSLAADEGRLMISEKISLEKLKKLAESHGGRAPRQYAAAEKRYARSPFVAEWAKRRAGGVCDLCGKNAPFRDKRGAPYLEAHHVKPLAAGGDDSIKNVAALCPNCHRKMHSLQEQKDIDLLTARAGKE